MPASAPSLWRRLWSIWEGIPLRSIGSAPSVVAMRTSKAPTRAAVNARAGGSGVAIAVAVGTGGRVGEKVGVGEEVAAREEVAVREAVGGGEDVGAGEDVGTGEEVGDVLACTVGVPVRVDVGVAERDAGVPVGGSDDVAVGVVTTVGDPSADVAVTVGVRSGVGLTLPVTAGVGVDDAGTVGVALRGISVDGVDVGFVVDVGVDDDVGSGEAVVPAVAVNVGSSEGVRVAVAVALATGVGDAIRAVAVRIALSRSCFSWVLPTSQALTRRTITALVMKVRMRWTAPVLQDRKSGEKTARMRFLRIPLRCLRRTPDWHARHPR